MWMRVCTVPALPPLPRRQTSTLQRSPSAEYRLPSGLHTNDSQPAILLALRLGAPAPPCAVTRRASKNPKLRLDRSPPLAASRDLAAAQASNQEKSKMLRAQCGSRDLARSQAVSSADLLAAVGDARVKRTGWLERTTKARWCMARSMTTIRRLKLAVVAQNPKHRHFMSLRTGISRRLAVPLAARS